MLLWFAQLILFFIFLDVPDLTASLWSFIQCAKFYVDLPLGHEENLKLLAESLTRLMWQTTSLWSVCEACLGTIHILRKHLYSTKLNLTT